MRKRSKLTSEVVRKKCVELAKKIVRRQHNYTCEFCGKREPNVKTHGSHIFSEGIYRSMSADLENILCLCFTHHLGGWNAKEPSWHKNPIEMTDWFKEKFPARYKTLKEKSRSSVQCDLSFWENKLKKLQQIWNKLEKKERLVQF